ncbi:hypothetical protein ACFL6I_28610 [candidate division KSB1 bacterium]
MNRKVKQVLYAIQGRSEEFRCNTGVIFSLLLLLLTGYSMNVFAQTHSTDVAISGQWFLSFQAGENEGADINRFYAHRGYLTFKPTFTESLSARITPDITIDNSGDVKVRLKYMYMNFNLPSKGLFTKPYVEFGLAHRAWLDYEEHIDYYRMQGTMFLERNHLFNSADFGVTFVSLFGGEMDSGYQERVNNKYPGRYGSMALGVYNGGGYHAVENNTNKIIESRVSLRPLPDSVPGLQASYFGVFGKGNTIQEPDWTLHSAFLSYEHEIVVATAQYYTGKGNSKGDAVDANGTATGQTGYSFFSELKIPDTQFSVIGRFDSFDPDTDIRDNDIERAIVGVAYRFHGHKALLDYDNAKVKSTDSTKNSLLKFTVEVYF